jgi:hypothetical protein
MDDRANPLLYTPTSEYSGVSFSSVLSTSVVGQEFKMPAAPKNPVKGTTIQAGCNKNTDTARMPPAWVVFTNERDTGAGVNRVPLGFPNSSQLGGATNLLGVTIGGICDAAAAAKFPESEGRYAVAVEGKVVVALVLESG